MCRVLASRYGHTSFTDSHTLRRVRLWIHTVHTPTTTELSSCIVGDRHASCEFRLILVQLVLPILLSRAQTSLISYVAISSHILKHIFTTYIHGVWYGGDADNLFPDSQDVFWRRVLRVNVGDIVAYELVCPPRLHLLPVLFLDLAPSMVGATTQTVGKGMYALRLCVCNQSLASLSNDQDKLVWTKYKTPCGNCACVHEKGVSNRVTSKLMNQSTNSVSYHTK